MCFEIFLCVDHIQETRGQDQEAGVWRSVDSGKIHPDCPPLRVLGPQWRGGRRSPGPGVARQPRSRRSGWSPHVGQENHHQTRLPAATVRQVKYFSEIVLKF